MLPAPLDKESFDGVYRSRGAFHTSLVCTITRALKRLTGITRRSLLKIQSRRESNLELISSTKVGYAKALRFFATVLYQLNWRDKTRWLDE
jgi:hypothetical protein